MLPLLLAVAVGWTEPGGDTRAASPEELSSLPLDALLDRLPRVGHERTRAGLESALHPASAELRARLDAGVELTDAQWRRALLDTGAVRWRERWPAGEPVAISLRIPEWLEETRTRLELRSAELGVATAGPVSGHCAQVWFGQRREALYRRLAPRFVGREQVAFEVSVETTPGGGRRRLRPPASTPRSVRVSWHGLLELPLESVPTLDDALPPRADPELDRAVADSLGVLFQPWGPRRAPIALLAVDPALERSLAKTALSLEVEVLHRGEVVERAHVLVHGDDPFALGNSLAASPEAFGWTCLHSIPAELQSDPTARAAWVVRVVGTSEGVLRVWDTDHRWAGELRMDLDELVRRRLARLQGRRQGPWISALLR